MRTRFDPRSLTVILLFGSAGCFHGADVSKIRCNDSKYCPKDYVCIVPANSQEGRCVPSGSSDAGGGKIDGAIALDGPSSKGGATDVASSGGTGGIDSGNAGGMGGTGDIDASAAGGAGADGEDAPMATGGTSTGGAAGSDAGPNDLPPDVFTPDAPGTCSTDKDCPAQQPLCLGNRCAKCGSDNDCVGRSGPACASGGLCVACTANSYCKGTAATCDTTTNQCVGCTKRGDCSGACQTCSAGVCVAVKNQDDPTVCAGTCDATGACKSKQGQTCKASSDCVNNLPCADGYCCDKACKGTCEACDVGTSAGTCTTLAANATPHTGHPACVSTDATCVGRCDGTSAACAYPSSTSVCAAAVCSGDSSVKPASVCNGAGACTNPAVTPCGAGKYCSGSSCVSQNANGGSCQSSNQCTSGNCSNGLCCSSSQTGCGSSCVFLSSSNANCGSCGRSCAAGSSCSGGSCYLIDGQSCNAGNQCLSGVCSTFYLDADGDGYGISTSIARCGTTPPSGYAVNPGDCCDSDANAHPGQASFFTVANKCGSYDYNCDGS
jgi:hypothetical protein